jgi:CheY-like chemotaxis protein
LHFPGFYPRLGPVTQPLAIVLYEKLLPGSKLVNSLQDLGYRVLTVSTPDALVPCVRQEKPMLVVADLAATRGNVADAIAQLKQNPDTSHVPVLAFAEEKDAALQQTARDAGAALVVHEFAVLTHLEQFLQQALHLD